MAKKIRTIKKRYIVFELFLFLLVVFSSFIFFYFHHMYQEIKRNYYEKEGELVSAKDNLADILNESHSFEDIDHEISFVKDQYFSIIKELEDSIISGKSSKKIAYLTFDDGPYYNTYQVLAILDKYGVGATFFTTNINGQFCHDHKEYNCYLLYSEYIKHGHTIANHTYTHAIFKGLYDSTESFMDAVIRQEEHIKNQTDGYVTNIVRFPGGSDTANHFKLKDSISSELRNRGYGWVDWTAQDGDGGYLPTREKAWKNFTSSIDEDIEVVLFHDYSGITTSILPDAIQYLKDNDYVMLPLFYESRMVNK